MAFDYTTLITSQYRRLPKFSQVVSLVTKAFGELVDLNKAMASYYDLDTAVGKQLDVIGLWVGCSRSLSVSFDNWFSFDVTGKGWGEGIWRGPFEPPSGLMSMDDVTYRRVLRAVIAANHWDGTLWNYHSILQKAMPTGNWVYAKDNFNMTITIHVTGPKLSPLMEALLLTGKLSTIKPAGVAIAGYVLPT